MPRKLTAKRLAYSIKDAERVLQDLEFFKLKLHERNVEILELKGQMVKMKARLQEYREILKDRQYWLNLAINRGKVVAELKLEIQAFKGVLGRLLRELRPIADTLQLLKGR